MSGTPVFYRKLDWLGTVPHFLDALCRDDADPDLWFPNTTQEREASLAKAICRACPHRVACVEYAITNEIKDGIFGGLDPDERARLRRRSA